MGRNLWFISATVFACAAASLASAARSETPTAFPLTGRVIDRNDRPVLGAVVRITTAYVDASAFTDANGYFQFLALKPGTGTIDVAPPKRYAPMTCPIDLYPARELVAQITVAARGGGAPPCARAVVVHPLR